MGYRRKTPAVLLCKSIVISIQWFQIPHIITFSTIYNLAVLFSGARVSQNLSLVPQLKRQDRVASKKKKMSRPENIFQPSSPPPPRIKIKWSLPKRDLITCFHSDVNVTFVFSNNLCLKYLKTNNINQCQPKLKHATHT